MSSAIAPDLIDFDDSPLITQNAPNNTPDTDLQSNTIDTTLIDSELPVLEQKLASSSSSCCNNPIPLVDLEEILISLDEDDSTCTSHPIRRSRSVNYLCDSEDEEKEEENKSWSCDNLEAISVLDNLDAILNESLRESDRLLDLIHQAPAGDHEEQIEACLQELDNYLQALEEDQKSEYSDTPDAPLPEETLDDEETLRRRLQKIEANYVKFLLTTSCNKNLNSKWNSSLRFNNNNKTKVRGKVNTIGHSRSPRPVLPVWISPPPPEPEVATPSTSSVHCSTGSVVVEAPRSWLRSSMRRLQHLRLPSDHQHQEVEASPAPEASPVGSVVGHRPVSAPSRLAGAVEGSLSGRGGGNNRSLSSSVSSLASTVETSPSCTPAPTPTGRAENSRRQCERPTNRHQQTQAAPEMPEEPESPLGQWPHGLSSMMACLGCTLGLFNISRFAILTVHFGANFIFQFFLLSLVMGLPLFTLQLCLGQQLGAGVIDMWRISPLFQGVGVALLVAQALLGLYSIIGVSWMFVFFRDSFITRVDKYRWAEPFLYYREDVQFPSNSTYKLSETIPDYFSGIVLQRHHLPSGQQAYSGTIKFQLAFNLAVVWMIVFVSLSKGLRSYGKVIYIFTLVPVFGTFVLCAKILGMMPPEYINIIFPETSWGEFFLNPRSWLAAAQEVFLTWGVLGAAVMQIASHNKHKHLLQRDSSLVAVITFTILLLFAFLANTCVQILKSYGYIYLPDSFERMSSYTFLRSTKEPLPPTVASTPVKYMLHNSFFMGEKVVRPGVDHSLESGYQVLRLATELIPATFAALGSDQVSPFWAVLFYFILITFGIAQQLAIWHSVITGIMAIKAKVLKSWETTITLFSCIFGYVFGLPMATEVGIYVVYFMDYTVGGIWWIIIIIFLQIVAVFMVRGRPYSGDNVVTALFTSNNHPCVLSWAPALLSFTWNVILPVGLMVLCITTFKSGNFREIFIWHHAPLAEYWPLWARQIGSMLQLVPILLVPLVAVIQSYRYLNNGPSDILEDLEDSNYRIQLLYRPPIGEHMTDLAIHEAALSNSTSTTNTNTTTSPTAAAPTEDPPPKYTPPPSYTTATGARIAKFLRNSIRRSVRRFANVLGESSGTNSIAPNPPTIPQPPDYNAVLVEMNNSTPGSQDRSDAVAIDIPSPEARRLSTLERLRAIQHTPGSPTITAAEVASILRSSFRRSTVRRGRGNANDSNQGGEVAGGSLSAENLVDSAAPIGETSLVLDHLRDEDDAAK